MKGGVFLCSVAQADPALDCPAATFLCSGGWYCTALHFTTRPARAGACFDGAETDVCTCAPVTSSIKEQLRVQRVDEYTCRVQPSSFLQKVSESEPISAGSQWEGIYSECSQWEGRSHHE